LHVDDLSIPDGEHLEAFLTSPVGSEPGRRSDDLVANLCECGLGLHPPPVAFLALEGQDLTGLVRTVSGWGVFPPQTAASDATPLVLLCDERNERLWITTIQRLGRRL